MKIRQLYLVLLFLANPLIANLCCANYQGSDSSTIRIGKSIPEITFDNILNSASGRFSTKDLAKPTIMYFFSAVCKASFSHFAEINEMYWAHKNDFDLILVGLDLDDGIQEMYQMYSRRYDLNLPITFDRTVYKQYNIRGVPHVIWINEKGTVQAITNVLYQGYLDIFIEGKEFDFIGYDTEGKEKLRDFNPNEPFLVNGNGGEAKDFTQRSLFAEWEIGMPRYMPWPELNKSPLEGIMYLQVIGRELSDLYRIAYLGKTYAWHSDDSAYGSYHYSPILEVEDKSRFESDYSLGKNLFCYSQILPPERRTPGEMMSVMQRDLKSCFDYDVAVETREMPYLSLVASEKARKELITSGKPGKSTFSLIEIDLIDKPVSDLIVFLSYNLNLTLKDLPLIDETGIQGNIDISFNAIMTDFEDVKKAMQRHGLDMLRKEKPMKVIVIKEP